MKTLPARRVGESLKIPRQIMARVGNLGGISKEDVAAGVAVLTDTGTSVSRWIGFLNACTPMSGFALSVTFTSGSIPHRRARAFPSEQFACSKSAWVTRHSLIKDRLCRAHLRRASRGYHRRRHRNLRRILLRFRWFGRPGTLVLLPSPTAFPRGPVPMFGCQIRPRNSRAKFLRATKNSAALCGHGSRPSEVKGRRELRVGQG